MVDLSREVLVEALEKDPDTTHKKLAQIFSCSDKTIANRLRKYGLRTKRWSERKHSEAAKQKISQTRVALGVAAGKQNPNFGDKERPWLEGAAHPFRRWHNDHPDFGEKQRGGKNPVHKARHLYDDPAYVQRITRGIRAHAEIKRGATYEETYGPVKAAEYREKLRAASPARMAKFTRRVTWPEKKVRQLLESTQVGFIPEAPLGHYTVDFLVPGAQVVIQADGDFWHGNPDVYKDEELSTTQRKQRRLDASCDSFLRNRGYCVVRFWEKDLKTKPHECRRRLIDALEQQNEQ